MLVALMYHRVGKGKHANTERTLDEHFETLSKYPNVLPGDPLPGSQKAFCLTFDDATYDFYDTIFPMLKKHGLKALLGVPTRYILESSTLSREERLSVPYTLAMQDGFYDTKAPFCTWEEIHEMVQSGHVEIASHSHAHCNLNFSFVDLEREVVHSKQIIEERTHQPVNAFIYPFGKVNHRLHQFVLQHYAYAFRIGSAVNWSWKCAKRPLARISADNQEIAQLLAPPVMSVAVLKGALSKVLGQLPAIR